MSLFEGTQRLAATSGARSRSANAGARALSRSVRRSVIGLRAMASMASSSIDRPSKGPYQEIVVGCAPASRGSTGSANRPAASRPQSASRRSTRWVKSAIAGFPPVTTGKRPVSSALRMKNRFSRVIHKPRSQGSSRGGSCNALRRASGAEGARNHLHRQTRV